MFLAAFLHATFFTVAKKGCNKYLVDGPYVFEETVVQVCLSDHARNFMFSAGATLEPPCVPHSVCVHMAWHNVRNSVFDPLFIIFQEGPGVKAKQAKHVKARFFSWWVFKQGGP